MKRLISALILREIPMLSNIIKYFTDPEGIAKKRTLVTILSTFAAGLIAAKGLFAFVCEDAIGRVALIACSIDIDKVAIFLNAFIELLNRPEVGAVGFLSGLWALVSAYRKEADKK